MVGGRLATLPQHRRFPELGYDRFRRAIYLPPLCSPRDGPRYHRLQHECLVVCIASDPQEGDTVSRSRTRRLPARASPQMSSRLMLAIGQ
jgi:hypothetical protein